MGAYEWVIVVTRGFIAKIEEKFHGEEFWYNLLGYKSRQDNTN